MIRLECSSFSYEDGPEVLAGIDLGVAAGELVNVVGPSGSGKTTLARLLAGQTGADAGAVFRGALTLGDQRLDFTGGTGGTGESGDPRIDPAAWSATVAYAAQGAWGQLSMLSATVAEEIAFGPANHGVPMPELRDAVHSTARRLRLTDLLERDPRRLSGGQLQRTVLAAAVVGNPRVLVLDEPFQGLDTAAQADVAAVLEDLRSNGTGIVICGPLLPADSDAGAPAGSRVVALAEGRQVFAGSLAEARGARLDRFGIGTYGAAPDVSPAQDQAVPPGGGAAVHPAPARPADGPLVKLRGVSFAYGQDAAAHVLREIDLRVGRGDVLALTGANGSGKSTLLQLFNGLLRPTSGSVELAGKVMGRSAVGRVAGTVGFLFQDTDQQLFERTVLREVSYGPAAAGRKRADAAERARTALAAVGLEQVAGEHPYELGFVQRRLVALASIIASGPALWVLDEPTAGLDQRGRALMARLILGHAAAGGAVVLATHDDAFARAVCTRVLELTEGRLRPGGPRAADVTQ